MNCGTCKYYHPPMTEETVGTCRRNPPSVLLIPIPPSVGNPKGGQTVGVQGYFPPVGPDIYCGAYVVKMAAAN